ncbi:MAG: signal peptidase I [Firmicutes bacterium]|nr:signal peptidase I [Bacillota bacterium]
MLTKIKNLIFRIVYILILVYLMIYIPSFWGYNPLVVVSGSMEPSLKVGGLLYYNKEEKENFKTGDIIVFKSKEHIISHRLVEKTKTGYITKGDANDTIDPNEIKNNQLLGEGTKWCIPYLGYYADFIYSHKYLLYISIAIITLDLCNDAYREHKKKMEKSIEKME